MRLHKLLIYLRVGTELHLVEQLLSESEKELEQIGQERKQNNPQYVAILTTFSIIDARILN